MNKNEKEKKKTGRYVGIFLAVLVVAVFCLTIGLSACSNNVPDEETEDKEEVVDTVQAESDKKPAADKDKDKDKNKAENKDKVEETQKQKSDKDKVETKPEKNSAPTVKPSPKPQPTPKPVVPTEKPSKPTPAPTPKPTDPPTPKPTNPPEKPDPTPPTHVHTWEDVTEVRTTGYNEEQVLVEEAYDEQITIGYHDVCNGCGASLSGMSSEAMGDHLATCGAGYHNEPIYQTIHHEAVYETIKTPITETVVIGRRCTSCGTYEAY